MAPKRITLLYDVVGVTSYVGKSKHATITDASRALISALDASYANIFDFKFLFVCERHQDD